MGGLAEGYLGGLRLRMAMQQTQQENAFRQQQLQQQGQYQQGQLAQSAAALRSQQAYQKVQEQSAYQQLVLQALTPKDIGGQIVMPSPQLKDFLRKGGEVRGLDTSFIDALSQPQQAATQPQSSPAQPQSSGAQPQAGGLYTPVTTDYSSHPAIAGLIQGLSDEDKPRALALAKGGGSLKDAVDKINALATAEEVRSQADKHQAAQLAQTKLLHQDTMANLQETKRSAAVQRSYQYTNSALDKIQTPIDAAVQRFSRLQDTLDQKSPQADALVAPELLSVMAGGAGSGIRMNEAEIARIVGGRSHWQDLKAAIQRWNTNPDAARSITGPQDQQIRNLIAAVGLKLNNKQAILEDARKQLVDSEDMVAHRKIYYETRDKLDAIDKGGSTTVQPAIQHAPGKQAGLPEGQTGTGSDGKKYIVKGGVWVAQ